MKVAELLRLIKLAQEGKIIVRHTTREVSGVTASDGYVSHRFEEVDIMEMDIRRTPGNSAFMMDRQVYQLTADVNVSSGYGYDCSIKRFYSYE